MFDRYSLKNFAFRIVIYAILLSILGVFVIYSATSDMKVVNRQILGIIVGIIAMFIVAFIDYHILAKISSLIYIISLIILVLVLIIGYSPVGAGATRWIKVPFIGQIQPSEFVKLGMIIVYSSFLAKDSKYINEFSNLLIYIISSLLIFILILLEPDLSTTIVLFVIASSMLFVAGISYKWICGVVAIFLPLASVFIWLAMKNIVPFFKPYQARRIIAWLNPEKFEDLNLQQANSIMAIASGQLKGKGINNAAVYSVKNGNFVSQDQTDFIFAVIGEELGFIGSSIFILILALLVFEILILSTKSYDKAGNLICVGVATLIIFQSFTNISVATGIFPNTGLPLPFVSYGVSSLFSMYIALGLVLNVGLLRE